MIVVNTSKDCYGTLIQTEKPSFHGLQRVAGSTEYSLRKVSHLNLALGLLNIPFHISFFSTAARDQEVKGSLQQG